MEARVQGYSDFVLPKIFPSWRVSRMLTGARAVFLFLTCKSSTVPDSLNLVDVWHGTVVIFWHCALGVTENIPLTTFFKPSVISEGM